MKIGTKIRGGFMIMVVICLVVGIAGVMAISTLTRMSDELYDLELEANGVAYVLEAHYTWRHGLTMSVLAGAEFTGSVDPATCALGKWLNSEEAKGITDSEIHTLLAGIHGPHDFIHHEAKEITGHLQRGSRAAATAHALDTILPETEKVISILAQMDERYYTLIDEETSRIVAAGAFLTALIIVFVAAALAAGLFFSWLIPTGIVKPLSSLTSFMHNAGTTGDITLRAEDNEVIGKMAGRKDEMGLCIAGASAFIRHVTHVAGELEDVAGGDLTTKIELLSDKDVMGKALVHMVSSLNDMFGEIHISTAQVSTGAKQIADGSQLLAQGSTEQAASIEQLSTSITEIAHKTKDNAEKAGKAATLAHTIKHNAEKGSRQMDEMMVAVRDINQASQSIQKVIKVIDDIAFQTNILALNAAVEAARAGQHGKGFAVVAEEVRNLASKSADAAKETGAMIEDSMGKAELGSQIAGETAVSLAEIVHGINESSQIVEEIARSSEDQSAGIEQINRGIDQVAQVVQQNSATAEESAAASEEMSGQSAMLEDLIAQFKLKDNDQPKRARKLPAASGEFGKY